MPLTSLMDTLEMNYCLGVDRQQFSSIEWKEVVTFDLNEKKTRFDQCSER